MALAGSSSGWARFRNVGPPNPNRRVFAGEQVAIPGDDAEPHQATELAGLDEEEAASKAVVALALRSYGSASSARPPRIRFSGPERAELHELSVFDGVGGAQREGLGKLGRLWLAMSASGRANPSTSTSRSSAG